MSGGKGSGGILITSGAECGFDLRSPYDVTNLVTFTGLNAALVKQCISEIPRLVLLHSDNRRYYQKSTAMAVLTNEKKRANFDTVSGRDNGDGNSNKKPKVTT
ncbi:hypothetical protein AX774_g407 [Zancudomyces culisetae]|uniref:Uncharacterized protein n=1 Tax=Zancudomyces culisetae TaxID=1213189 RepID=A0A1R1PYJ0_ZANCU|nr:hypothetical protein AX774_g407 [Zancudomyces culisetae]|eukprot:OMH86026.1 hypothetical protein AX774_g407 [Zancudomyces culisetae]